MNPRPDGNTTQAEPAARPVAAHPFLSPPQLPDEIGRLGAFRILAELGRGGMGVVFRAEEVGLKRLVALKVMLPTAAANPGAVARFQREAEAQAKVVHDHIIVIHRVDEANGVQFLAMPLLSGQTLSAALKQNRHPPVAEVVRVGSEMAEGLAAAHDAGLVHRDIKPANVWLEGSKRRVKILDFGLARVSHEPAAEGAPTLGAAPTADDGTFQTAAGAVMGTPAYMSPEQARGLPLLDARTDLFSLGVVLYEMTTGKKPFTGPSAMDVMAAVVTLHPQPPHELNPDVPPQLSELIRRLMAKDADQRPATAAAVAEELEAIGRGLAVLPVVVMPVGEVPGAPNPWADIADTEATSAVSEPSAAVPVPRPTASRKPLLFAATAVLLAGAAVAAVVVAMTRDRKPTPDTGLVAEEPKPPAPVKEPGSSAEFARSVGMKLVPIPAGKFQMGSPRGTGGAGANEFPQHEVAITRPFYMGAYEVTVGQFRQFVKESGYKPAAGGGVGPNVQPRADLAWDNPGYKQTDVFPVSSVSWDDAVAFCAWLSKKEGRTFRLPTEAEWEYAARAGTTGRWFFGDTDLLDEYANHGDLRIGMPEPVGRRKPNPWGLYDIYGNVWEWCADRYDGKGYPDGPRADPTGATDGANRMLRGGGWTSHGRGSFVRSTYRYDYNPTPPTYRHNGTGFRVVAEAPLAAGTVPSAFFNGKDLTGWGVAAANAWLVEDGALVSERPKTAITTHQTFSDFELSFRVRVALPEAVKSGMTFKFRNTPASASALHVNADTIHLSGSAFPAKSGSTRTNGGGFNDVTIRCVGRHVAVTANGVVLFDGECDIPPDGKFVAQGAGDRAVTIKDIRFTDLSAPVFFNGKDLTGFTNRGDSWKVVDGTLVGIALDGKGYYPLATVAQYTDFDLSFRIRYERVAAKGDKTSTFTFRQGGKYGTITFADNRAEIGGKSVATRENEFNDVTARCVGKRATVTVNGETLLDEEYAQPTNPGILVWQSGRVGHTTVLRDIKFTDLSEPAKK